MRTQALAIAQDKDIDHRRQLARLNSEAEALRRQLRRAQRMAAVGTMTAVIAHEFNNILTPIINYAQLAKSNPSLTDKAINRAADGGLRASAICKAILGMTRNASCQPEQVNIRDLLSETLKVMARDPKKDQIEVVLDIPDDLIVTTQRVELQQVLLNLLANARAAVMERLSPRRIVVSVEQSRVSVLFRVADTGVGISPRNIKKIFEPFFTTKESRDSGGGHGLGLYLCKEIVESMGGEICAESTIGEGAVFTILLPL